MDTAEALQLIRDNHRGVLMVYRRDGAVQASPVAAGVDAEGRVVISSRETAFKTKNLRQDPWVQLCVLNDGFFGDWIYVEGEAEVVSLPEAMEPLVEYYRGISGEAEDWDEYRAAMVRERRVILRLTPTRAGPDRQG